MYLDISFTNITVESVFEFNPSRCLILQCIYYGGFSKSYGEEGKTNERRKIQKYIDAYPQILFCHPYHGFVNITNPTNPIAKLSLDYYKYEISNGFKRGVVVYRLQSDENIIQYRRQQQELMCVSNK
jgi:hypothetical protein